MTAVAEQVSVCICTYKRSDLLRRTLDGVAGQQTGGRCSIQIVVSDNDVRESARSVVEGFRLTTDIKVTYCVEPVQNIALARNRAIANAEGEFIAFIDDDEVPARDWLLCLLAAYHEHGVDGVLGPVLPLFEHEPPRWLVRGKFCERPSHDTGAILRWSETRTGNVLLKREMLAAYAEPFRPQFRNGGEDDDFFKRMMAVGRVFCWCNEAVVHEFVPPTRCKRWYLLKRALLRGQNQRYTAGFASVVKSLCAVGVYAGLLPVFLLMGQHRLMNVMMRLCDHLGKVLAVAGWKPLGDEYPT